MNISAIRPRKIAVIGSGISGLACAWLLNKTHQVTLYEKDDRLGGHSNTVSVDLGSQQVDVDTGFIVFNPDNYPNLVKLFEALEIATCETDMSFAVSLDQGRIEYSGCGLAGLFAQKRNLLRPGFWSMLFDLLRFYRRAGSLVGDSALDNVSLGELLRRLGYGKPFIQQHLLPMSAAIWSTPADRMLHYPASSFLRFCSNHGLVQLKDRPQWRTVIGGSRRYVDRIGQQLAGSIRLNSRIHRLIRQPGQVVVEDLHGGREIYDDAVLACHADQALALLADPSEQEQALLSRFPYQRNQAFLHLDDSLMPRRRKVWSSWNYLSRQPSEALQQVYVSYWMNRLQPLNSDIPLFVTLNPLRPPAEGLILRSFFYDHPAFDRHSLAAQKQLWSLQGQRNTWFCGAYFGYGFHEDGLQAGLAVAEQLGGLPRPWHLAEPNGRIHVKPPVTADSQPAPQSLERSHD